MNITDVRGASSEAVNHPSHYAAHYRREVIELTGLFDFTTGNAMKYVLRCRFKARPAEDLQKARWYLNYYADHPEVGFASSKEAGDVLADFLADLGEKDDFGRCASKFLLSLAGAVSSGSEKERTSLLAEAAGALDHLISRAARSLSDA